MVFPVSTFAKTYIARSGQQITLPDGERVVDQPAISPDGRQVAYIRVAGRKLDKDDPQPTEVVINDVASGKSDVVVRSGAGSEWYIRPAIRVTFGIDGRRLFVERAFPGTSSSVHEIDLVTGKERLVAWGDDIAVLRDGSWRGDLLMSVHTCYRTHAGCDYPIHVVTPAGRLVYVVRHRLGAAGTSELRIWLSKRGWRAW